MLCWFSQGYSEIYHLRNFFQKPICDEFVQEFQGFFFSSIGKCPSLLHTPTARFSRLEAVQEQMINPGNIKGAKENKEFTEFTISPSGHAQYVIGQWKKIFFFFFLSFWVKIVTWRESWCKYTMLVSKSLSWFVLFLAVAANRTRKVIRALLVSSSNKFSGTSQIHFFFYTIKFDAWHD